MRPGIYISFPEVLHQPQVDLQRIYALKSFFKRLRQLVRKLTGTNSILLTCTLLRRTAAVFISQSDIRHTICWAFVVCYIIFDLLLFNKGCPGCFLWSCSCHLLHDSLLLPLLGIRMYWSKHFSLHFTYLSRTHSVTFTLLLFSFLSLAADCSH